MAAPTDFYGPELKAERAEHHIRELERIFAAFVRKNRQAVIRKASHNKWRNRPVTFGGHFPRHTPTVLGDAIHNLRASLDHAYCILVQANGHTLTRKTSFPFGGDRDSVKGSINGAIGKGNGPSDRIRDAIIDDIQPFPGGKGERLYGLHKLDITDKHEVLIPTATTMDLSGMTATTRSGSVIQISDFKIVSLNPEVQKEGLMVFGPDIALKTNNQAQSAFDICFQRGQPFEGESIAKTLGDLAVLTRGALEVLRMVQSRPVD